MARSRKPKRKASRKKSRSLKQSRKRCPPGCVKRKVARKVSRKRRSVKRKVSRKRKSAKRKSSRKRKNKFRLSNQRNHRHAARKHNSRCDKIVKDHIKKFFDISNKLYNLQSKLGCGVKTRDNRGRFLSRHPYATPLTINNILTLMDRMHPKKKGGNRALSSRASSYRSSSRVTRRQPPRTSRDSRDSISRRLDFDDMSDLIDSMSIQTDQDPDMPLGRRVQQLNARNLAELERQQRLASAGMVSSPSSTISRPRTSPPALRSRSGTVQELENAPTVIMDDRAETV